MRLGFFAEGAEKEKMAHGQKQNSEDRNPPRSRSEWPGSSRDRKTESAECSRCRVGSAAHKESPRADGRRFAGQCSTSLPTPRRKRERRMRYGASTPGRKCG